jgi:hypothetical protein
MPAGERLHEVIDVALLPLQILRPQHLIETVLKVCSRIRFSAAVARRNVEILGDGELRYARQVLLCSPFAATGADHAATLGADERDYVCGLMHVPSFRFRTCSGG